MADESVGDAGASSLGYYGGAWAPDGAGVVAHGFTGALHLWRRATGAPRAPFIDLLSYPFQPAVGRLLLPCT
jgi:elongator complex protein 2